MAWERETAAAVDAVIKASRLCAAVQQRLVAGTVLEKGDKSPVTVADFVAQAVVGRLLEMEFPRIPMVGEENAPLSITPSSCWRTRQTVAPVSRSSLTSELAAWT